MNLLGSGRHECVVSHISNVKAILKNKDQTDLCVCIFICINMYIVICAVRSAL